jgi:glucan biosynthesis protein C
MTSGRGRAPRRGERTGSLLWEVDMHTSDRLHALDAVRAFALLSGIALHAAQPFIAGLPWVASESPSNALAAIWYSIHMFRMPVFFLIAGFFGRMMLEQRGTPGFIKDRSRRILVPLVIGLPIVMLVTGIAYVLGALAAGVDPRSLQGLQPPPSSGHHGILASVNLIHLWFLYYLALFYAAALLLRSVSSTVLGANGRLHLAVDATIKFLMRGLWGPVLLAIPIVAYYCQLKDWSIWGGLPAPMSLMPDSGALLAYGLFFGFGWLLHRQQGLLSLLSKHWLAYCVLAVVLWVVCRAIGGSTPHWGPYLRTGELVAYTASYVMGSWCWAFALIGVALRYLSSYSAGRRYLADSSYWVYLMHIPALIFFEGLLHPLPWPAIVKYLLSIAGAVPILLLSYHYLVRFTFIGATLNGRRRRLLGADPQQATTVG